MSQMIKTTQHAASNLSRSDLTPTSIHPAASPSGLNPRQEEFCREVALDPNATRATLRAGYSWISTRSQASRLLSMPPIQARVAELRRDITAHDCAHMLQLHGQDRCHLPPGLRTLSFARLPARGENADAPRQLFSQLFSELSPWWTGTSAASLTQNCV